VEELLRKKCNQSLAEAVILAGGLGARLGSLTQTVPKPMLNVGGRPFVEYLVWNLRRHGIRRVLFSVGYLHEQFCDYFGDGARFGVHIEYVVEHKPAGTGGALKLGEEKLGPVFFILNGDTLTDINYGDLISVLSRTGSLASISLRKTSEKAIRYGTVTLDGECVTAFSEKRESGSEFLNSGVYAVRREVLDYIPAENSSLEHDVFPVLAKQGLLSGKVFNGYFLDIGVPESLRSAQRDIPAWQQRATRDQFNACTLSGMIIVK
jgi:NDP-sugar pyrophosphorylase family protein